MILFLLKNIKVLITFLFCLGIFLLPFNNIDGLGVLREYAQEAAIYPWLLGGVLLILDNIIKKGNIYFPHKSLIIYFLFFFIAWCLLLYLFNYSSIQNNFFKSRSGNNRFVSQFISLLISSIFLMYYFWNVIRKWTILTILTVIRSILFYTFLFVFVFAMIEAIVNKWNFDWARNLIHFANYLPIINKQYFYNDRLSSVSFEVPALGNFLITVAAWMFSYILTKKNKWIGIIPTIMVIFLVIFSGARAATLIVLIQFFVFLFFLVSVKQFGRYIQLAMKSILTIIVFVLLCKGDVIVEKVLSKLNLFTVENNISNQTRYGMQYATLKVFEENPIVGVGLGQNGFHKKNYYPEWAIKNNYEFTDWYMNEEVYNFPPDFNLFTRLLAETGVIGFILFIIFLFSCFTASWNCILYRRKEENVLSTIVFISLVGFVINWMQIDYFRQFGFWFCLIILLKIIKVKHNNKIAYF
ncbi:O-antigen ligase family protein [Myroides injenensis]|uniref:O-antigen ligase family protein n=1 Tax=Myroides injenensis TaxID=1183151 RepID=UPI0002886262|nr:O-antigen polymerase [Myroides injenensis]